jgi:WD40 repeat protein
MRESNSDSATVPGAFRLAVGRPPRRGWSRLPIPAWCLIAGVGIGAWGLFRYPGSAIRDASQEDPSLVGKQATWIGSVAFDPTRHWLASAGGDGVVHVWDIDKRELVVALAQAPGCVGTNGLAFRPDGSELAVASKVGPVTLWKLPSGTQLGTIRLGSQVTRCLAFSPDGRLLATGSLKHGVALWDAETLQQRTAFGGGPQQVNCVVFSADGRTLAAACADGTASLWEISSGRRIRIFSAPSNDSRPLIGIAFSPDGQMVVTAGLYSGLAVWDRNSGRRLYAPVGPESWPMAIAFSPTSRTLAFGTSGGRIEIWDAGTGRRISAWRGHSMVVKSLAFSPDGRILGSGGDDGAVRVWDVP